MRAAIRQVLFGETPFSPRQLFANGENGAWYEPKDYSTLFQTSAGASPVTNAEQPVGLMLDKRNDSVNSGELLSNGSFANGTTGWIRSGSGSSWSVTDGILTLSATSFSATYQTFPATIGATYFIRIVAKGGSVSASVLIGSTAGGTDLANSGTSLGSPSSDVQIQYRVVATTTLISVKVGTFAAGSTSWANISAWSIAGNHASQSTLTARPTAKNNPARLFFDADPDSLTINFATSPGVSTVAYGVSGGDPVINTGVNISGTTYALNPTNTGSNLNGLVIVNRALTATETAKLTAYLRRLS